MTKAELVVAMAEKAGLDRKDARTALDAFVACITAAIRSGTDVRIVGFGNFVAVHRPAGTARNPKTGAAVARAATTMVKFRAGEGLKRAIQR